MAFYTEPPFQGSGYLDTSYLTGDHLMNDLIGA
jgi:hypothetical protein